MLTPTLRILRVSLQALTEVGADIIQDVKEPGDGLLIAQINDAAGYVFRPLDENQENRC